MSCIFALVYSIYSTYIYDNFSHNQEAVKSIHSLFQIYILLRFHFRECGEIRSEISSFSDCIPQQRPRPTAPPAKTPAGVQSAKEKAASPSSPRCGSKRGRARQRLRQGGNSGLSSSAGWRGTFFYRNTVCRTSHHFLRTLLDISLDTSAIQLPQSSRNFFSNLRKSGGALFNDVRRDDGGSAAITLQSLANKDYGAIKNRRRGVTARDGCGTFDKDCLIS